LELSGIEVITATHKSLNMFPK